MNQEEFNQLTRQLIEIGEDKNELELWQNIYPNMEPTEKLELIKNLEDELKQLQDLKNKQAENS